MGKLESDRVYWLGGSPCSGKSSVAQRLAVAYGMVIYKCDDHYEQHMALAQPDRQPLMSALKGMTWNDIWMRPVAVQTAAEIAFYGEEFPMILADLERVAQEHSADGAHPCILVEGCNLLPELVAPVLPGPNHACWMVPTPAFQRHHYGQREFIQYILAECTDPAQAWENWMGRDEQFAEHVATEAQARGLPAIWVDGKQTIEEIAGLVAAHYRIS